jgi:hypothetical protein
MPYTPMAKCLTHFSIYLYRGPKGSSSFKDQRYVN